MLSTTRSQGLRTASGVVTFRIEGEMMAIAIAWAVRIIVSLLIVLPFMISLVTRMMTQVVMVLAMMTLTTMTLMMVR